MGSLSNKNMHETQSPIEVFDLEGFKSKLEELFALVSKVVPGTLSEPEIENLIETLSGLNQSFISVQDHVPHEESTNAMLRLGEVASIIENL